MSTPYTGALSTIARHRGVLGAMVVDAQDDIIIDSSVRHGVKASTVAALGASIYRKARQSATAAGLGDTAFLRIEGENGHIFAAGRGGLVLIAMAESSVNVGLVRLAMLRAAAGLS
jgi:predicted regulator of Ras-like GTPase activity (Roadblock/LC7/MglB family)